MTEKEMRCVKALRICHSNEDCRDCEFMESDTNEKSCVNTLFEDAADIIESLSERFEAAQPKWISVEERLPQDEVIAANFAPGTYGYKEYILGHVHPPRVAEPGKYYAENDYEILHNVTHWMFLPPAPENTITSKEAD